MSGFWHGANWTFIVWGLLNALYFLPLLLQNKNRRHLGAINLKWDFESCKTIINILGTFLLTCLAWIFFRANSVIDAFLYIKRMFLEGNFRVTYLSVERYNIEGLLLIFVLLFFEWFNRNIDNPLYSGKLNWLKTIVIIIMIITLGVFSNHLDFIYFQF